MGVFVGDFEWYAESTEGTLKTTHPPFSEPWTCWLTVLNLYPSVPPLDHDAYTLPRILVLDRISLLLLPMFSQTSTANLFPLCSCFASASATTGCMYPFLRSPSLLDAEILTMVSELHFLPLNLMSTIASMEPSGSGGSTTVSVAQTILHQ
jgi:hypothetical protein